MKEVKEMVLKAYNKDSAWEYKHVIWNAKAILGLKVLEQKDFSYDKYKFIMDAFNEIVEAYEEQEKELKDE